MALTTRTIGLAAGGILAALALAGCNTAEPSDQAPGPEPTTTIVADAVGTSSTAFAQSTAASPLTAPDGTEYWNGKVFDTVDEALVINEPHGVVHLPDSQLARYQAASQGLDVPDELPDRVAVVAIGSGSIGDELREAAQRYLSESRAKVWNPVTEEGLEVDPSHRLKEYTGPIFQAEAESFLEGLSEATGVHVELVHQDEYGTWVSTPGIGHDDGWAGDLTADEVVAELEASLRDAGVTKYDIWVVEQQ